jgi:hypothetical protein
VVVRLAANNLQARVRARLPEKILGIASAAKN